MNKKHIFIGALIAVFSATMVFRAPMAFSLKKQTTIKIGSFVTPQSVWGKTVAKTIKNIENRTGGAIKVSHIHSGTLGSGKNMLDQVLIGGIQGAGVDTATLASIVPEVNIIELPFLFEDHDEAYYLIDNVISPVLKRKFNEKGLVTSAIMETGFMDFVMSGPVRKPEDLKSMKIGSWESPVHIAFWKSQGASPMPIPATEVFNAYARGMVDSGANSANALIAWDKLFGTGLKRDKIFITRSAFTYQAGILVINKKFYDSMDAESRNILMSELDSMTGVLRSQLRRSEPEALKKLASIGYNVGEMSDKEKAVFEKNSRKVYSEMRNVIGGIFLDSVMEAREKYRSGKKITVK
jgi:TRAP-type C4-dicarboxylate transport system substrate-binding protein